MKRLIFPTFVLLFTVQAFSQDVLTMRSGATYEVKLLEINDTDLRFKMYNNPDGPLYTISRGSFASVRYENGVTEVFARQDDQADETVAINGYNVSPQTGGPGTNAGPATNEPARPARIAANERKKITDVVEAILFTGLLAIDIATEAKASARCCNKNSHVHCSR